MSHKNKVFLSSTQFGDEFKNEREVLPLLFQKEPLSSIFELWKIENQSAGVPIDQEYIRNVKQSAVDLRAGDERRIRVGAPRIASGGYPY